MTSAPISEIYTSLQGEGPYTGERQIFLRLAGCPFRCDYCDTPLSLTTKGHPVKTDEEVLKEVESLSQKEIVKTISITGGEPLSHIPFLMELLPKLKKKGFKLYLESAGINTEDLEKIVSYFDVIAMDIKLPSAIGKSYWEEHKKFLALAKEKVFTKMVLEDHTPLDEVKQGLAVVKDLAPQALFVIQPVTPQGPHIKAPSLEKVEQAWHMAKKVLKKVQIMPQQHKIWGVR